MEVRLFPNSRRPGVGLKPRREAQRPLSQQNARQSPVLEAGSALGYLVYPPLESKEAFKVGYEGEGRYRFEYYVNPTARNWERILSITVTLPAGGDRKSTRLNSSHSQISYAVFCLKKKTTCRT